MSWLDKYFKKDDKTNQDNSYNAGGSEIAKALHAVSKSVKKEDSNKNMSFEEALALDRKERAARKKPDIGGQPEIEEKTNKFGWTGPGQERKSERLAAEDERKLAELDSSDGDMNFSWSREGQFSEQSEDDNAFNRAETDYRDGLLADERDRDWSRNLGTEQQLGKIFTGDEEQSLTGYEPDEIIESERDDDNIA